MDSKPGRDSSSQAHIEVLHQGGNNNAYPPDWVEGVRDAKSYNQLDDTARGALLRDNGSKRNIFPNFLFKLMYYPHPTDLFGVRIDGNEGPRRGVRQVARHASTRPLLIQETNNIDSEVITTENGRDTNYVHKGWSLDAISDNSPWTLSRIARNNCQVNSSTRSITKYIMIQKLRVDLSPEDLSPVPELEKDFREALSRPTRFDRSNAVYRILERWGDVIPLVFDIGVSLAVTDLESAAKNYLGDRSFQGLQKLSISATARPSTRGGDPATLQSEDNIRAWLGKPVPLSQWEQVRIIKTIPLIAILDDELQSQLAKLDQSLTTYCPNVINTIASSGTSFDGTTHAFSTISRVAIYFSGNHVRSISVTYTTEPSPVKYGEHQANHEFTLQRGEHITDMLLWKDHEGVCGIQLSTSRGRNSKHFGSQGGTPEIMRNSGGCLSGFSGIIQAGIVYDLQTIWRHDVQGSGLSGDREFSQYFGGMGGSPFSDWPFVQHSDSAHVSRIRVKCGKFIDGIQITYSDSGPGMNGSTFQYANYHGGSGGQDCFFQLGPNEHIVAVGGRHKKYIDQLWFKTNKGRTSETFGGGGGDGFTCQAPKTRDGRATRLHYICGKSAGLLDGILLVWAPL